MNIVGPPQPAPSLRTQTFWLTAAKMIGALVNIALPVFLVRTLSQTEFGVYKQAFVFTATAVMVSAFGVGLSAYYFIPRRPERAPQVAQNILIYNAAAGSIPLLILIFYPDLLNRLFRNSTVDSYATALGFIVLLTMVANMLHQLPVALQDVRSSTVIIIGTQLSKACIFATAAFFFQTVGSLIAAALIHLAIETGLLFWYIRHKFGRVWAKFDRAFFWEQVSYALPTGLTGLLYVLQKDLPNYFVGANFSAADFAIYAVGCLQVPLLSVVVDSVAVVLGVRVSGLQHRGETQEILRLITASSARLAAFLLPVTALLLIVGRDLIVLFYTTAYESSSPIFSVSILFLPLSILIVDPVIRAYMNLRGWTLTQRVVVTILLTAALPFAIQRFGMIGAVTAALVASMTERIGLVWLVAGALQARWRDITLLSGVMKAALATAVAAAITASLHGLIARDLILTRIALASFTMGVLYTSAVYIFRLPGSEELQKERLWALAKGATARFRR